MKNKLVSNISRMNSELDTIGENWNIEVFVKYKGDKANIRSKAVD